MEGTNRIFPLEVLRVALVAGLVSIRKFTSWITNYESLGGKDRQISLHLILDQFVLRVLKK